MMEHGKDGMMEEPSRHNAHSTIPMVRDSSEDRL